MLVAGDWAVMDPQLNKAFDPNDPNLRTANAVGDAGALTGAHTEYKPRSVYPAILVPGHPTLIDPNPCIY